MNRHPGHAQLQFLLNLKSNKPPWCHGSPKIQASNITRSGLITSVHTKYHMRITFTQNQSVQIICNKTMNLKAVWCTIKSIIPCPHCATMIIKSFSFPRWIFSTSTSYLPHQTHTNASHPLWCQEEIISYRSSFNDMKITQLVHYLLPKTDLNRHNLLLYQTWNW